MYFAQSIADWLKYVLVFFGNFRDSVLLCWYRQWIFQVAPRIKANFYASCGSHRQNYRTSGYFHKFTFHFIQSSTLNPSFDALLESLSFFKSHVLLYGAVYCIRTTAAQEPFPSRAPSFIVWKHQSYPTNQAISRHIRNSRARKLHEAR